MRRQTECMVVLAAALAVLATAQPLAAQECVKCINVGPCEQDCAPGGASDHCVIFYEIGCRWCNMVGSCEDPEGLRPVNPTDLSPGGTYVASSGLFLEERGVAVHPCTGFILAYSPVGLYDGRGAGVVADLQTAPAEEAPADRRARGPTSLIL